MMFGSVNLSGVRAPVLILILLCPLAAVVSAEPRTFEGKRIAEVSFVPPDQPIEPDRLERIVQIKAGDVMDLRQVSAAIERLYGTGRYINISADAELRNGDVVLRFLTTRAWFIGRVDVTGVDEPPNAGQLVHATKLELGASYNEKLLRQGVKNLADMLRGNGFHEANVTPKFDSDPRIEQINFRFDLVPGPRATLSRPVITGDPRKAEDAIVRATHWQRLWGLAGWRKATEYRVRNGVERVRNSYLKTDNLLARVSLVKMDYNEKTDRLTPTLHIEAGPKVVVRTSGVKVSRGKLKSLIPVFQEQSVDGSLLVEGRRNLAEYMQSQGYFEAEVDYTRHEQGPDREVIEFQIDRGERHKLVHVEVSGQKYFDEQTIRERMYIQPASFLRFRHGRFSQKLLDRDCDAIADLYRTNGFRDVEVASRIEEDYQGVNGRVAVYVEIKEGPQWRVAGLDMSGVDLKLLPEIEPLLQSTSGQPFSEFNVASDRDSILGYYFNNGYPDAVFEWASLPADRPQRVNLRYTIREGPRRYVRDIVIGGLKTTNLELVKSRITVALGDPLSQSQIVESQRGLYDLGIFARVDTAIQNPEGRERNKYVLYQFEEAKKYSLTTGFGAEIAKIGGGTASLESPAGNAGFSPRVLVGISRINFLGVGHTLSLNTRASTIQQRALLTYLAPQFTGEPDLNLSFNGLFDVSKDVRTFSARRLEGSVQLGNRLSKANTIQYRLIYRRVSVSNLNINPQLIPLLSQAVRIGIGAVTFVQDRRDDPTDARRGIYNTLDFGLATKALGSQTDFFRTVGKNSTYHRLTREVTFARTLTIGWLRNLRSVTYNAEGQPEQDIPLPERFFSGGASSHRGFAENQAGPRDLVTGFPIGGRAVLTNSFELRFPLLGDNIGGVLFHDAGNVYSNLSNISFRVRQHGIQDFDYMVHAVGFGIRYRTPIGPVRLDLAFIPNPPQFRGFKGTRDELLECRPGLPAASQPPACGGFEQRLSRFQFHFSLGQAF